MGDAGEANIRGLETILLLQECLGKHAKEFSLDAIGNSDIRASSMLSKYSATAIQDSLRSILPAVNEHMSHAMDLVVRVMLPTGILETYIGCWAKDREAKYLTSTLLGIGNISSIEDRIRISEIVNLQFTSKLLTEESITIAKARNYAATVISK